MSKEKIKNFDFFSITALVMIFLGILAIFCKSIIAWLFNFSITKDIGEWGNYISGITGSLWALAGVILFYRTLLLQKKEIEFQREELGLQREEIRLQKEEMKITNIELKNQTEQFTFQNKNLVKQQLENSLFELIKNHHSLLNSIEINNDKSHHAIRVFLHHINTEFRTFTLDNLKKIYPSVIGNRKDYIDVYITNFSNILSLIDLTDIVNKEFYFRLAIDQLSSSEKKLIIIYCIVHSNSIIKKIIDKNYLFQFLNDKTLQENIIKLYTTEK